MNNFSAIGRIGKDAITRHTQAGKAVAGWSLAVDVGYGENKTTVWLDCSLWGDRAAKVAEFIKKGDRLGVQGEIGTREHEGRSYVTLNVREVTLLGEKPEITPGHQAPKKGGGHGKPAPLDDGGDDIPFITNAGLY